MCYIGVVLASYFNKNSHYDARCGIFSWLLSGIFRATKALAVRGLNDVHTKVWIKSYGSALVRIRWKFSDEALWIRGLSTNR